MEQKQSITGLGRVLRLDCCAVKESDRQIYVWAHMLDEAFGADLGDRSYWAVWLKEYPQYEPDSPAIKKYLAGLFDRRMQMIDGLGEKLRKYARAYDAATGLIPYERMKSALLASFGPEITDREFFWEPIPARTYKALVSRSRARSQGQASRDVSPRVLKECLDSICRAASIITTHSGRGGCGIVDVSGTRTAKMLREAGGSADKWCLAGLYAAVSSFCTFENGQALAAVYDRFQKKYGKKYAGNDWMDDYFDEFTAACDAATRKKGAGDWLTNNSDGGIGDDIAYDMRKEPYDVYEKPEQAVPLISILVDKAHLRGDVAGAFVEGGAPTCQAVSDMAPDELYEGRR